MLQYVGIGGFVLFDCTGVSVGDFIDELFPAFTACIRIVVVRQAVCEVVFRARFTHIIEFFTVVDVDIADVESAVAEVDTRGTVELYVRSVYPWVCL